MHDRISFRFRLADAVAKGLPLDKEEVLKAMVSSSTIPYLDGTGEYMEKGYVALDHNGSAASLTLEYAYDDWTIYHTALWPATVLLPIRIKNGRPIIRMFLIRIWAMPVLVMPTDAGKKISTC